MPSQFNVWKCQDLWAVTSWCLQILLSFSTFRTHSFTHMTHTWSHVNQLFPHIVWKTPLSLSHTHTYTCMCTISHWVTMSCTTHTHTHIHQENMEKKGISSDITVTANILNSACLPWQPNRSSVHILTSWNLHVCLHMCECIQENMHLSSFSWMTLASREHITKIKPRFLFVCVVLFLHLSTSDIYCLFINGL